MSEKRFTYGETIDYNFFDVFEEKKYLGMIQRDSTKIVDRLNEQQSTITKLKELNDDKGKRIISLIRTNKTLKEENEQLKKELKRCKDWINSDKNDYELTLAFIKNKGYSLKDVLEYEKELFDDE